jgi:hypothetical protein
VLIELDENRGQAVVYEVTPNERSTDLAAPAAGHALARLAGLGRTLRRPPDALTGYDDLTNVESWKVSLLWKPSLRWPRSIA